MTDEEYAAFMAYKEKKAADEAAERLKALRTSYAEMAEEFIDRTINSLTPLSEEIAQKKGAVLEEFSALQSLKAELLKVDEKMMPKSHTFTNQAGDKRVTIGVYETDGYDDSVEEGIAIVKSYIESLATDSGSKQLVSMVLSLLARNAKGALKASRVVRLRRLAEESGDPRFMEGVRIIEHSYRPTISKTYVRCEVRRQDPTTGVIKDWEPIPLGMTES